MPQDVFISYSAADQEIADLIYRELTGRGITCWIAHGDMQPGVWSENIVRAIEESRLMIIVLSSESNESQYVFNEISLASEENIPIIPFKTHDFTMSAGLKFHLQKYQWINAYPRPAETYIGELADHARQLLDGSSFSSFSSRQPECDGKPDRTPKRAFYKHPAFIAVCALLIVALAVYFGTRLGRSQPAEQIVQDGADRSAPESSIAVEEARPVFNVYTDSGASDNHFMPSGFMGNTECLKISEACTSLPHSGTQCIQAAFTSYPGCWAGVYWQSKAGNWGNDPFGYDISGASSIEFYARGQQGGEQVEFYAGGITGSYPDTLVRVSTGYVTLTRDWQLYKLDVSGRDLKHVVGGFGFTTNESHNPGGAVFYLDDIVYQ